MNIFEYNDMMKRSQNQARPVAGLPQPAPMSGDGMMMNYPQGGLMGQGELIGEGEEGLQVPQAPKVRGPQGDPSAMAAYGMQAPQLPDPSVLVRLKALMSMLPQQQQQRQPMPQGGLMAYLQQLGER